VITSLTSITSELAKVQYLIKKDKAEDWEKAEKAKNRPKMRLLCKRLRVYTLHNKKAVTAD